MLLPLVSRVVRALSVRKKKKCCQEQERNIANETKNTGMGGMRAFLKNNRRIFLLEREF